MISFERYKKIGILGGSFDPIHNGHLAIAESAYRDFHLDEVWLIPAGHSPNKDEDKMTSAAVRAEMTALAAQNIPYFKLSTYENNYDLENAAKYAHGIIPRTCPCILSTCIKYDW